MLKRIIYLFMIVAMPLLAFGDVTVNAQLKKGNEQYAKGQYKEAIATYQKIADDGHMSALVYFNLGNAYFKNNDVPSALLYYEKAHKLSPGDEDINFNIQFANQKTTDKVEAPTEFFITRWWHSFILRFSLTTLAVISVLLMITGFALLVVYRFTNSVGVKKASFYAALLIIFLGLGSMFTADRQQQYFDGHHGAIIFSNSVNVKSAPTPTAKNLFLIHDGTKVDVLDNNNGWMRVKLANGSEGWINASDAREI
ncbi:tetratricopeptide repeat protein [Mucilaginibacter celer]|nr:tetratricopeptide repeat protein [Mucilaginibacter celer]